ncbi:PGN_0703 family putative restriction endonuclease [Shumkonia mesophila]|uniref:PGN_0703 family putative restriction endonuclease n=1 Tax=Shumkonia mesophila TaxID=2838854 RepID=UPI0029346DDF|nr:hypothetical protein [Shumkonia mesophila]
MENEFERIPLIPAPILKANRVHEPYDTRFRAAARLLQSLWRQEQGLPVGYHRNREGKRRKLGSRLNFAAAKTGANFIDSGAASLVRREVAYRELGAFIDEGRLYGNLLSSQPLCFNLFGPLKLDRPTAEAFFKRLFPDFVAGVEAIWFEHSPGRGSPQYTDDHSAFDVFVRIITTTGESGFIAIEVKYSESMQEPISPLRPRYDEASDSVGVFIDHMATELREAPLQQLWREHLLSRVMLQHGLYAEGRFVVIAPAQNTQCGNAVRAYQKHLKSEEPAESGFQVVALESCLDTLDAVGAGDIAAKLRSRYLDFGLIDRVVFGE